MKLRERLVKQILKLYNSYKIESVIIDKIKDTKVHYVFYGCSISVLEHADYVELHDILDRIEIEIEEKRSGKW